MGILEIIDGYLVKYCNSHNIIMDAADCNYKHMQVVTSDTHVDLLASGGTTNTAYGKPCSHMSRRDQKLLCCHSKDMGT